MSAEDRDSLRSIAKARIIDALCEGPIEGLVAGMQSVYLNGVPVENLDGSRNFTDVMVESRLGTQAQDRVEWAGGVEAATSVQTEVIFGTPIERTITDAASDAARITITIPALYEQTEAGNIIGTRVDYQIAVKTATGPYVDQIVGSQLVQLSQGGPGVTTATSSSSAQRLQGVIRARGQLAWSNGWQPTRMVVRVEYRPAAGAWSTVKTFDFMADLANADTGIGYWDEGGWVSTAGTGIWEGSVGSFEQNVATGSSYEVRVIVISGASSCWFQPVQEMRPDVSSGVSGKASSGYQRSHLVRLPAGGAPWTIRVTRTTAAPTSNRIQNRIIWDTLTAIFEEKLRYPHTALMALSFDSKQFSGMPSRSYRVRLLRIKVPTNYDPIARSYTGTWDGTFKIAWSNNPVWCWYDLATNRRYGVGDYISESMLDKWSLYDMAVYCDQLVPDGRGGFEPRFTCNLYLQTREEAYRVLQDMAGMFRAMSYWGAGTLNLSQDKPASPVYLFTNANVVDGAFEYTGSSQKVRRNAVLVAWSDPAELYKQAVEYVDDPELIARWGYVSQAEVVAMGCTSRAMAYRVGRWLLYTERYESEMVTFETGLDGNVPRPGDVIEVADQHRAGARIGGRLVATPSATQVTLDQAVTLAAATVYTLSVLNDAGQIEERTVTTAAGTTASLTVAPSWTGTVSAQSIWMLSSATVQPALYRVIGIAERDGGSRFNITALAYNPGKYAFVDQGASLPLRTTTVLPPAGLAPPTPTGLSASDALYVDSARVIGSKITLSWEPVTTGFVRGYLVSFRTGVGNWTRLAETQSTSADILDVVEGVAHQLRVVAISQLGIQSAEFAAISYTPLGKLAPPTTISGLTLQIDASKAQVVLSWPAVPDLDLDIYEIRTGASWSAGTVAFQGKALVATLPVSGISATYRVRARDSSGVYSIADATSSITVQPPSQPTISAEVIDNNVLLRWNDVPGSLAIDTYEIRRGATWATAETIGTKSGLFTTVFEVQAGAYTYWVAGIDRAGNYGTPGQVSVFVSAPPDYVLQLEQALTWGTLSNAVLAEDKYYIPVSASETWETHFTSMGWNTPQDQVNAGFPIYIQPGESSGHIESVIDAGATLSSSKIAVTATQETIGGAPSFAYTISVSNTSSTGPWTNYSGQQVFATNFRWVKIRIAVSSGIGAISDGHVRLEIKSKSDSGEVTANAADSGGTTVNFGTSFISVNSITLTPKGTSARIAIYDFAGGANPTSFKALLYDTTGTRVSGSVSWQAFGV